MTAKKRSKIVVEENQKIVSFSSLLRLPVVQNSKIVFKSFKTPLSEYYVLKPKIVFEFGFG